MTDTDEEEMRVARTRQLTDEYCGGGELVHVSVLPERVRGPGGHWMTYVAERGDLRAHGQTEVEACRSLRAKEMSRA